MPKSSYKEAFAILFIPALTAIILLYCAKYFYPHPHELEAQKTDLEISKLNGKAFWLYLIGACFIAIGFADFPLIAFHFAKANIMSAVWIPIIYSFAMGIDGLAALGLGYLYDKSGFGILIVITLVTCLFAPLVFLGSISVVFIGIALWSIGVGAHESLMRAIVAKLIPINKRASAYGIFNMSYGIAWFLGSLALGSLYDISLINLVIFSVCSQLISIPFLWKARSYIKTT